MWRGLDAWRSEVAQVELRSAGLSATGTQTGIEPLPYWLTYRLDATRDFVTRRLVVDAEGDGWHRGLDLQHSGKGVWQMRVSARGSVDLPSPGGDNASLTGALDCDLGFSPLTNSMPIRRSGLEHRDGAEDFLVAWVSVPDLAVVASAQRYEHVRRTADGSVVRYVDRGLFEGFETEIELDRSGLVLMYPGLAERVVSRPTSDGGATSTR